MLVYGPLPFSNEFENQSLCFSSLNFLGSKKLKAHFKNLPEIQRMNLNLGGFKVIDAREVTHLFTRLQACQEAALLIPWVTNKESWLANPNRAVMLSERYNNPWGNLKWVGEMLRIEESC